MAEGCKAEPILTGEIHVESGTVPGRRVGGSMRKLLGLGEMPVSSKVHAQPVLAAPPGTAVRGEDISRSVGGQETGRSGLGQGVRCSPETTARDCDGMENGSRELDRVNAGQAGSGTVVVPGSERAELERLGLRLETVEREIASLSGRTDGAGRKSGRRVSGPLFAGVRAVFALYFLVSGILVALMLAIIGPEWFGRVIERIFQDLMGYF